MKAQYILILLTTGIIRSGASQTFSPVGVGFDNNIVRTLLADTINGYLYAGGGFWLLGDSTPMNQVSRWKGVQWEPMDAGGSGGNVLSFSIYKDTLYAGGAFYLMSGVPNTKRLAKWDGNNWHQVAQMGTTAWDGTVVRLEVLDNNLYVMGLFENINGIAASKIAAYDGNQWLTFPPLDTATGGWAIYTATIYNGELYVGGNFDSQIAPNMKDIAKWNGQAWVPVGNGLSGFASWVSKLIVYNNELYAAGYFDQSMGDPSNNIMKLSNNVWVPVGQGVNSAIYDMCILNGELYVGGYFTEAGSMQASRLAKWDGSQWHSLGAVINNAVDAMAVLNGELYFGSAFTTVNSTSFKRIGKYTPATAGVTEHELNELNLFANPITEQNQLLFSNAIDEEHEFVLYDITGRVARRQRTHGSSITLTRSNHTAGIYIFKLRNTVTGEVINGKVVFQ